MWNAIAKNWRYSLSKIQCSNRFEYCGYQLQASPTGTVSTLPSTNCITDLIEFPVPDTKRKLQSLLGLVITFSRWVSHLSSMIMQLRELTRGNRVFKWQPEHSKELAVVRRVVQELVPVCQFQPGEETLLYVDLPGP